MNARNVPRHVGLSLTLLAALGSPEYLWSDACSVPVPLSTQGVSGGDRLVINSSQLNAQEINAAISYWSSSCPSYGVGIDSTP